MSGELSSVFISLLVAMASAQVGTFIMLAKISREVGQLKTKITGEL